MGVSSRARNCAFIFFGVVIIGLLLFTGRDGDADGSKGAYFNSPLGLASNPPPRVITTEDVVSGKYYARTSNSTWIGENELSWTTRMGDLISYNTSSGEKRVIIKSSQFQQRPWKTKFSRDLKHVLVSFSPQRVFRSTILARYAVHDAGTGDLIREISTEQDGGVGGGQAFQLGIWSNDNSTLFLVYKNDLYAVSAVAGDARRLTWDGSEVIFNGIADWVFEEEIFVSTSTAVYSSSSGLYVSYLKFNDTVVEPVNYLLYGEYAEEPYFDEQYQYPKYGSVRYPKTGTRNPSVSIHVVNIREPTCWTSGPMLSPACTWEISLNSLMSSLTPQLDNFIIGQFKWSEAEEHAFTILVFNRIQNHSWIVECSYNTRNCKTVHTTSQSNGWIDNAPLHYSNGFYVTLTSVPEADKLEYMHVVAIKPELTRMYTRGTFSVDEIVQISRVGDKEMLIFKAPLLKVGGDGSVSLEDPSQSHYYTLDISDGGEAAVPVCVTCGGGCVFNSGKFYGVEFVNVCERERNVSVVQIVRIGERGGGVVTVVLDENKYLGSLVSMVTLPEVLFLSVPYSVNGRSYNLSVKVIGPVGWREGRIKEYPVVMDTYSGPNSQKVTRKFNPNDWSYALASNPTTPVVYVVVDGIGSGRQSSSLAFEVYRDLGNKEIHDKVYAMKHLLRQYKSLDPDRTLIWGWSYGGYVSAMTMGKDTERVFKCGISVAPVVNWYYYDTMYTERYMSTPNDNVEGYNSSNVIRYTDNFENKKYLLVHGNADDNVHYQQSMVLARCLEQKGILFRMQSYPDENHSLGSVRVHLYRTLEDFVFNQCFRK